MRILGNLQELMLMTVQQADGDAYASWIFRMLNKAGHDISIGSVSNVLTRLEEKGYVTSRKGSLTGKKGGRKICYVITPQGVGAIQDVRATRLEMRQLLQDVEVA